MSPYEVTKNQKLITKVVVFMHQEILKKEQKLLIISEKLLQTKKQMNLANMIIKKEFTYLV